MNISERIKRVALWKKFVCLGLLCLAAIFLPTYLYWKEVQKDLNFAKKEQQGLPQVQLILNIIQRAQQHRGLSARYLQESDSPAKELRTKSEELEAAIFAYERYLDINPNDQLKASFAETVSYWHNIHRKIASNSISHTQSFEQHTYLIKMQLRFLREVIDYYQLSLDPESDGYFLIDASLMQLPHLVEVLGQIRGYGNGLLTKGSATDDERAHLQSLILLAQFKESELELLIKKVVAAQQKDVGSVYDNYKATRKQFEKVMEIAQSGILGGKDFTLLPDSYYSSFTLGVNSYYAYAHFAIDRLDIVLHQRILKLNQHMLGLLFYVLVLTLIVSAVCVVFVRRLLRQLGGEPYYAAEVVETITLGDLDCEVDTEYPDSLLGKMKIMQEKLKTNDRLKNEFVSTVSHELRTPLTAIAGALSLAVSGQLGALPSSALKLLDIAQKNTLRLTDLINDLLDIDKLSLGKLEMDMRVQLLMPIVDEACLSMTSYFQKYGVHLSVGPRFEHTLVKVDERRLRQVLVNFLSNAAKFSNKGDEIVINASVSGDCVRIEVIDHGAGIPEEFQSKIFEKFSQADGSDRRQVGGTGLGLAIAKELIQQMNGTIGFTSRVGVGSCFYVELPLEEANSD